MEWAAAGLIYAFFNALVILTNEKYRVQPALLGMCRGFGGALAALPALFFIAFPHDPWFWAATAAQGVLVGYFDYKLFTSSARFGAAGTSMMTVLAILISVLLWWLIDYQRLFALARDPRVFAPLLVSLAGCTGGYLWLTGGRADRRLLKYMLPAVFTLSFMTLNAKNIVMKATFGQAVTYYVAVVGTVGGLFNLILYRFQHPKGAWNAFKTEALQKNTLKGGALLLFASLFLMISKTAAMTRIPNPGYLNALALTSPLWILLAHRLGHIRTRVSIPAMLLTLISMAAMVYLAGMPLPQPAPY